MQIYIDPTFETLIKFGKAFKKVSASTRKNLILIMSEKFNQVECTESVIKEIKDNFLNITTDLDLIIKSFIKVNKK